MNDHGSVDRSDIRSLPGLASATPGGTFRSFLTATRSIAAGRHRIFWHCAGGSLPRGFLRGGPTFRSAWWLEPRAVTWEIDRSNWRQGATTNVSLRSRRPREPTLRNSDLTHLFRLHHVVSLDLSDNDRITTKGLAALRGLEFLTELKLERMYRYREPELARVSASPDRCMPGSSDGVAATGSPAHFPAT